MGSNGLTSLLYFLAFGLFFYWIMKKGGCGLHAHGSHGRHDHAGQGYDPSVGPNAQHADVSGSTKDPICGMPIDPKRAVGMRTVRDRTFYFCSADCLAKFDADPEGMASRAPAEAARAEHGHHRHHGC
ncbi:MAG: YHS domain-containing protein [Myxococcota bacterium]|nr:YHS domain-containing protein [Myxococcota bacterium]